jgi:DNA-binding NtrC family response regulator
VKAKTTIDQPRPRNPADSVRPYWLELFGPEGPSARTVPLRPGRYVLGREDGADVVVDDPRVSRVHATLHVSSRSLKVRLNDEESRHGTFVHGDRIAESWLTDGDVVRIGDTFFLLRLRPNEVDDATIPGLVGVSAAACALRAAIAQVADHDVTVMIRGESGTGKEVVARSVHALSGRRGSFVALNCAAIPAELAESQLFGHVAGAFTGARSDSIGFFRAADGGTVFLDEIGDMPLALQPKLLRALEQREVVPVGATTPVAFDARVVVATHRDLDAAMRADAFRGDLFARLAQFQIAVPSLAERVEDVLPLLAHALGDAKKPLEPDLVERLLLHAWPFNVRELFAVAGELSVRGGKSVSYALEPVVHRLEVSARRVAGQSASIERSSTTVRDGGDTTTPIDTGSPGDTGATSDTAERAAPPTRDELEKIVIEHKGNVRAISRATGRSRMQVYRWVEQHNIDLTLYRD